MRIVIEILKGLATGGLAGFVSGLLGVSPGGILVPVISLVLGFHQRLAQAVSLVAQAPPTSLSGVSSYTRSGRRVSFSTVAIVSLGFIAGGPIGAAWSRSFSDHQLRWMFVTYLVVLVLLALIRGRKSATKSATKIPAQTKPENASGLQWLIFAVIGAIAGVSSGLLGIGGGLAITALSVLLLRMGQHEAQALSLVVTALPLTLPAAWMYVHQGTMLPWRVIVCVILGLALGAKGGAMLANKLPERTLRRVFTAVIFALAIYMMIRA
jgi:uncharacterized protein